MSNQQALKTVLEKLYEDRVNPALNAQVSNKCGQKRSVKTKTSTGRSAKGVENFTSNKDDTQSNSKPNKRDHVSHWKRTGKDQPVQQLEQRYGQLRLTSVDNIGLHVSSKTAEGTGTTSASQPYEDMPGVKRPADPLSDALAVAGRKGSQPARASLKASEQTPKQKAGSFAQRPVIFVDLTVDDPERPAEHDSIGAIWDASPMSIGRSPTEKV